MLISSSTYLISAVTALQAYQAWALALGVSDSDTLQNMNGDDTFFTFQLAAPCFQTGATNAELSSEGILGWSGSPKTNMPVLTNYSRSYFSSGIQPDYFLGFRLEGVDCGTFGTKLQKSGSVTIGYGRVSSYSGTGPDIAFAFRFSGVLAEAPRLIVTVGDTASAVASHGKIGNDQFTFVNLPRNSSLEIAAINRNLNFASGKLSYGSRRLRPNTNLGKHGEKRALGSRTVRPGFSGNRIIAGTTKVENVPTGPRKVRLFDKQTALLVAETWSENGSGNYEFHGLAAGREYFAVGHDYTRVYNAVIADMLVAP